MIKIILTSKRYWITVLFLGLGFCILISVVEHIMQYKGINVAAFMTEKIAEGRWMRYLASRIVGGMIYGGIMGYYMELRKRKAKR